MSNTKETDNRNRRFSIQSAIAVILSEEGIHVRLKAEFSICNRQSGGFWESRFSITKSCHPDVRLVDTPLNSSTKNVQSPGHPPAATLTRQASAPGMTGWRQQPAETPKNSTERQWLTLFWSPLLGSAGNFADLWLQTKRIERFVPIRLSQKTSTS